MVNKYLMNVLLKLSGGNQEMCFTKLNGHPAYYLIRNWDVKKRFSEDEITITLIETLYSRRIGKLIEGL